MTEEDKTTIEGGSNQDPAEMNAERRNDGGRRSDRVHPGDAVPAGEKDTEGTEVDDRKVFLPGENKTREEIESQFRNDPHFSALFDHTDHKKKADQWSIMIGGLRLTLKRILILAGFLFVRIILI